MRSAVLLTLCVATLAMAEDDQALRAVSASTGSFSTQFFKEVAKTKKGENLISSPLSADIVLSMTAYGARGNTYKQMQKGLYLPSDDKLAQRGFKGLLDQLNNVENVTLELANKVYLAKGLQLNPDFKELTSGSFRSETSELDVADLPKAVADVNSWVKQKTHEKIDKILKEDDIDANTRMVLLNAVYFKGKWAQKFKPEDTKPRAFKVSAKEEKQVPTMFVSGNFKYGELADLKAKFIELPYSNENLKMVIIVPDEVDGLGHVVDNLESFNSTRLAKSGYSRDVQLYLPKFKIESTIDLKEPLQKLGMTEMFENTADFKGISEKESLKVGKVLQKAFIEVNEEGSEAAAVTVSGIVLFSLSSPSIDLIVDRPFYYEIVKVHHDSSSSGNKYNRAEENQPITLFHGMVTNPL